MTVAVGLVEERSEVPVGGESGAVAHEVPKISLTVAIDDHDITVTMTVAVTTVSAELVAGLNWKLGCQGMQ